MELDGALTAALRKAAGDPTRALRPPYHPLSWSSQLYPPAPPAELDESERRLGFRLPQAVRRLYGLVANGGFGPGYGLLGLLAGAVDEFGHSAVDSYLAHRREGEADRRWQWPWGLLPVCTWGCAVYSCVDCRPGILQPPMVVCAPGRAQSWAWSLSAKAGRCRAGCRRGSPVRTWGFGPRRSACCVDRRPAGRGTERRSGKLRPSLNRRAAARASCPSSVSSSWLVVVPGGLPSRRVVGDGAELLEGRSFNLALQHSPGF